MVDDEQGIRDLYKETLEECGYACYTASSGEAALEMLPNNPVDLLLLDILMPNMNGLTCFEHVRADYPDVGVVFLTAMDSVAVGVDTVRSGAYDYLVKPVTARRLEQTVEEVLARRNALLAERQRRRLQDEQQVRQLSQREQELVALNRLFQQHLKEHFAVVEAHHQALERLGTLAQHMEALQQAARSQPPLGLTGPSMPTGGEGGPGRE